MKKYLATLSIITAFGFASCTEVPVSINMNEKGKDTTYIAAPESPQAKKFLVEELSGVTCVNCPEGSEFLHTLNTSGTYKDKLAIIAIHSGTFTEPISSGSYKSTQDFRTEDGAKIVSNIFGGEPFKPCAGFDRLPLGTSDPSIPLLDAKPRWETMLDQATAQNSDVPINVTVTSKEGNEANEYFIKVKIAYTKELSGKHGITVYLTENAIEDVQQLPSGYANYTFEHIFRKAVSPYSGGEVLPNLSTKEEGRVFVQNYTLKIDPNDAKQKFWKPKNMEVVAFAHSKEAQDKRVYQTAVTKLIP